MSERIHALAQLLSNKSSVEEYTIEELQQLTKQYPYFAPAQFLLLQKLKSEGSPEAAAQSQKAVLYYHDPLQFDYFVSTHKFLIDESGFAAEKISDTNDIDSIPQTSAVAVEEPLAIQQNTSTDFSLAEENLPVEDERISSFEQTEESSLSLIPEAIEETISEVDNDRSVASQVENLSEETTFTQADDVAKQEASANENEENTNDDRGILPDEDSITESEVTTSLPVFPISEFRSTTENEHARVNNGAARHTAKESEATLSFEPYHTVDYFASQGIKIAAEALPKDKLGKQLKSFTEWLKTMKRLPASEVSKTPESPVEKTVESMANHSVADSDVITEAMAEVWVKQGAHEKAIETYNKLSLLVPSKKAYFAAKIENLKQS